MKRYLLKVIVGCLVCVFASVHVESLRGAPTSDYSFGCEGNPTGNPIGGGVGYSYILSAADADYVVSTKPELLSALSSAVCDDIIFVTGSACIDLTGEHHINIPGGVILASDRGYNGSAGALLYTDQYDTMPLFQCAGPNVRVTGLRLEGPDPEIGEGAYVLPNSRGISTAYSGLEVDNCEIWAWSHAGIILLNGGTDAYIHHNYIHHCQRTGLGYGISHSYGVADSLIVANIFDYCRHGIAATGTTGNSYEACYNYIGENANGHSFDMHGGKDRNDGTDIAGDTILIHHNTFRYPKAVVIRGIPNDGAWIYNNKFCVGLGIAVVQRNAYGNMHVWMNLYTP